MVNTSKRSTIDIETSGGSVECTIGGRTIVEVAIRGDGSADYVVEGREDKQASWVTTPVSFGGSADHDDTLETAWDQIRVRCTTGTGAAGDSAEVVLCAGGK